MTKYKLTYLYQAIYNDGTEYNQNPEDVSINDPSLSCFHDLKLDQIHYFILSNGYQRFILDLSDGGFSINTSGKFYLNIEPLTNIKLIHFRRVTLNLTETERTMTVNYVLGYEGMNSLGQLVSNQIVIK